MIEYNFKKIKPFKWFVIENFPFIEEDFDALTNWQLFCKLGKEMNKIIESQNNVGEQTEVLTNAFNEYTENLTNAFNELQEYVNNYFANLDVQEEINNKLDQMVEDGTLENIMLKYFKRSVIMFDTVSDMKTSDKLFDGAYAKTLGFHSLNDGGSAIYKISTQISNDINEMNVIALENNLMATFVQETKELRPEQIGAYSDGSIDSVTFIEKAIELNPRCVKMDGIYKVSRAVTLTALTNVFISGHGTIISEGDYALVTDGCGWCTIENLTLRANSGLHVTANAGAIQYMYFRNLHIYGNKIINSSGIYVTCPKSFNNEVTYEHCLISGFDTGIYINNTDSSKECASHKFVRCSTENCEVGQHLVNANYITFEMCRHVEAGSLKWITEGTCNQLLIIGGLVSNNQSGSISFSDNTSGLIVGRVRMGGIYFPDSSRPFMIVKGKIIPDESTLSEEYADLGKDNTLPSANYTTVYGAGRCYNTTSTTTTILDTNYYGGRGKVNTFMLRLGGNAHKIMQMGSKTFDINNDTASDILILFKWHINAGWTVSKLNTSYNN